MLSLQQYSWIGFLAAVVVVFSCTSKRNDAPLQPVAGLNDTLGTTKFIRYLSALSPEKQDSALALRLTALERNNQFKQVLDYLPFAQQHIPPTSFTVWASLASAYQNTGQPDSAIYWLNEIIPALERTANTVALGKAYRGLGASYMTKGEMPVSVDYFYKSMGEFGKTNDSTDFFQSQIELATVFFSLNDFEKSLRLHRESYRYFKMNRDTIQMAYILDGITVALNHMDSIEAAYQAGKESLNLYRHLQDLRGISVSSNNLAHLCKRRGDLAFAEVYLREGLAMMEKSGDARYIPVCLSNLGNCLLEMGKLSEAEAILHRAQTSLSPANDMREVANIQLALSKLYQRTGQTGKALEFRLAYDQLKDSLTSRQQLQIIAEAGERYQSKVKAAEIQRLKYENDLHQIRSWVLIGGLVAFFCALGGWLYIRHRRQELLLQKEKELLLEKAKTQDAELKLAYTELAAFAQKIQEKTRMLDELQSKMEINPEKLSDYLSDFYQQRILTEEDWELFKEKMNKVYPGILLKIKQNYPDISQAELRLLLLIKINLETREIAATLGISPDTVKKTRQRLRRRLGMSESDKLEETIRQF